MDMDTPHTAISSHGIKFTLRGRYLGYLWNVQQSKLVKSPDLHWHK